MWPFRRAIVRGTHAQCALLLLAIVRLRLIWWPSAVIVVIVSKFGAATTVAAAVGFGIALPFGSAKKLAAALLEIIIFFTESYRDLDRITIS